MNSCTTKQLFFHTQIRAPPGQREKQNRNPYNNIRVGKRAYQPDSLSLSHLIGLDAFASCETRRTFQYSTIALHRNVPMGQPSPGSSCTQMSLISSSNDGLVTVLRSIGNLDPRQNGVFLYNKDFCYESSH